MSASFKKILFLALFLRLLAFGLLNPFSEEGLKETLFSDAGGYHKLAVEILNDQTFGKDNPSLSAIRTPGYPIFIAWVYAIFGAAPGMVLLVQILLDVVFIFFLYRFVRENIHPKAAFWATLFYALDPLIIFFTVRLLSDYLFMFFIFLSTIVLWKAVRKQQLKLMVISSLLLAVAVYIRPVGIYLIWLLAVVIFFTTRKNIGRKFINSGIYLSIFYILLMPWMIRNLQVHDHLFFSTSGDYNLFKLYASTVESEATGKPAEALSESIEEKIKAQFGEINHGNVYVYHRELKQKALQIFKAYPGAFVKSYFIGIIKLFYTPTRHIFEMITGTLDEKPYLGTEIIKKEKLGGIWRLLHTYRTSSIIYMIYSLLWYTLSYVTAIFGAIILWKEGKIVLLLFLLIPIVYFVFISGQAGVARFKLPFIPFYLVLSGVGFSKLSSKNLYSLKEKSLP